MEKNNHRKGGVGVTEGQQKRHQEGKAILGSLVGRVLKDFIFRADELFGEEGAVA